MKRLWTLRWSLILTLVLLTAALIEIYNLAQRLLVSTASVKWMSLFTAYGLLLLGLLVLLLLTWTRLQERLLAGPAWLHGRLRKLPGGHLLLVGLLALFFPILILVLFPDLLLVYAWRAAIFWLLMLLAAALLHARFPEQSFVWGLAAAALFLGTVYRASVFLADISLFPFSLTWSEASRYYYASLFFSDRVYGTHVNPTVLHPTRYMLQSIPFLLGNLPLWAHRVWQVFLWLSSNALAAALLVRRVRPDRAAPVLVGFWGFLFFLQGPIWYHLVVIISLVLWGFDSRRPRKTLLVILAASAWAGISRVNWIPFPWALAILLYLLEEPYGKSTFLRYLARPALWVAVGTATGLAAQFTYAITSGNSLDQFGSSFTSDLLWYRLFPSATYPLGVLPGILLASLPVFWLGFEVFRGRWDQVHPLRWLGIGAILLVFFAGGLVVSAKIGGGSNLHNMDGYLALLAAVAAYLLCGRIQPEPDFPEHQPRRISWVPFVLGAFLPTAFGLAVGAPFGLPEPEDAARELQILLDEVETAAAQGGEVLFIAQRQVLALGMAQGVPLVEDYEKVFLMEMAMAGNPTYLSQFSTDLANRRFALIITDPVRLNPQNELDDFGEENNAWDRHITFALLCYYRESMLLDDSRVQILIPRINDNCPEPNLLPREN
jgi:hypothetical protein